MADTTPLGLKGLECAKLLLTQAKVSCWFPAATRGGRPTEVLAMSRGGESVPFVCSSSGRFFRSESYTKTIARWGSLDSDTAAIAAFRALVLTTCVCLSHGCYYRALQVGVVPGIVFYFADPKDSSGGGGNQGEVEMDHPLIRFAICKRRDTIEEAVRRIQAMVFPPKNLTASGGD